MNPDQTLDWHPAHTWVFVVGTLEWKHADSFPPFPKINRRDAALVDFFRAQGVPDTHIVYLQDGHATTHKIQKSMEAQLGGAGPGDLLVLYFCGHGAKTDAGATYFASYDADGEGNPGWLVDTIPATIKRHFRGSRAILLADCCHSGSLADAVAQGTDRIGYAVLTSSLASELSTGNWNQRWYPATILDVTMGIHYIQYDGFGAEWNEWVSTKRIRRGE